MRATPCAIQLLESPIPTASPTPTPTTTTTATPTTSQKASSGDIQGSASVKTTGIFFFQKNQIKINKTRN